MFVDIFLDCGSLLSFPVSKTYSNTNTSSSYPSLPRLYRAIDKMKTFLDYVVGLKDSSIISFTINDWTRLIAILTLSFRLSFPLALCPDFSSRYARSVLRLDEFLDQISRGATPTSTGSDLLSASRSVLGLAKTKYNIRLAALEGLQPARSFSHIFGCPIMAGNLDKSKGQSKSSSSEGGEKKTMPFSHDAWATMTMSWFPDDELL